MRKTALKNSKESRNVTILKIGHLAKAKAHAKAIAFAKWSVWVIKLIMPKTCENHCTGILEFLCAKNRSEKAQNIQEMR